MQVRTAFLYESCRFCKETRPKETCKPLRESCPVFPKLTVLQGHQLREGSRRKEIVNLLDLTGFVPNSSNMIMQGELFRLINMSSSERRELIEEIAGIVSYNNKKQSKFRSYLKPIVFQKTP